MVHLPHYLLAGPHGYYQTLMVLGIGFFSNVISKFDDCYGTRTHNHVVRKRILNHLAKQAKRLSCVVSTYPYDAFHWMFLSCHVRVSEGIHTLQFRYRVCFEQGVSWYSGNCRIWIHSETRTWHDKNIHSKLYGFSTDMF